MRLSHLDIDTDVALVSACVIDIALTIVLMLPQGASIAKLGCDVSCDKRFKGGFQLVVFPQQLSQLVSVPRDVARFGGKNYVGNCGLPGYETKFPNKGAWSIPVNCLVVSDDLGSAVL